LPTIEKPHPVVGNLQSGFGATVSAEAEETMTRLVMFEYDPRWPSLFERERDALWPIWQDLAQSIHHVGSTSVPKLTAKPIIDIMIVVKEEALIASKDQQISSLGYRCRGECLDSGGTPGRYYYSKDIDGLRSYQVHVMQAGHFDIQDKLDFRDYLRAHPQKAMEYGKLKARLVQENKTGIMEYIAGKTGFILDCIALARAWRKAEQGD
jgi:GrpB-like predicted nucleotidyltransferase (UPF0157 family)